jgi:DNA-directed RNA polymerase subunit M/transcription elongation factor TFIIS
VTDDDRDVLARADRELLETRQALRRAKRIRDTPPKFTCQACGSQDSRVIDSRGLSSMEAVRRRRECETCGARWTTIERLVASSFQKKSA